jgi:hypothetical protein
VEADDRVWRGPYRSSYGFHLVLVSKSSPSRIPPLKEVRRRVADDAQRTRAKKRMDAALDEIVGGYEIRVAEDVGRGARVMPVRASR